MKWLNYHHLYYFWQIAQEGGIAKAAAKLRLGQPTLSTQLKQLEDSLGHPLFERRGRALVLTEAGKVALDYANQIFRLGDEFLQVIDEQRPASRKAFRLGALDSVPKRFILKVIEAAQGISPCSVSVLEGSGEGLLRELLAHRLDLLISNYPPMALDKGKVFSRSLAKVPVSVFGAPRFKSLIKGFPQSLDGQAFVLPTMHSKLRMDLEHYFLLNRLHITIAAETQDTSLQKLLGIEGTGLVPLPDFAVTPVVESRRLIRLGTLPAVSEEFWLISASRRIQNPIAAELVRSLDISEFVSYLEK